MGEDAYVHVEAVRLLEEAFTRFSSKIVASLPGPLWKAESARNMLKDRQGSLRARIAECEAAAEEAEGEEDGDGSSYRAAAEEARDELSRIGTVLSSLEDARAQFQREARAIQRMGEENVAQARQFLRTVQEDLQAYLAKDIAGGGSFSARAHGGFAAVTAPQESAPPAAPGSSGPEPARFPLPQGFTWLPIDTIDTSELGKDLAGPDAWQKTSIDQMREGFNLLHNEVLKTFQFFGTGAGRDWFAAQDRSKGKTYEEGTERVFDAFFGNDPIAISRANDGKLHSIANGRHRIAVARHLGWTAVPVIFTDQRRK
jgi:hypothetical protein